MLIDAKRSVLLVVDLQEKMLPAIADCETLLANATWLIRAARRIGVPIAAVEQYPQGLGPLVPKVRELIGAGAIAAKNHFSCVAAGCLSRLPGCERAQIVVIGAEAHVCVLQSVLDLRALGKEVFVVADAVGSRKPADKELALARMRDHGIHIVSREMVAFEWLRQAGTDTFREISREFLR